MFKKHSYFLPTLPQCWILVLLFVIVGSIFSVIITEVLLLIFPESEFIDNILSYILMFIPPFIYVNQQGKKSFEEAKISESSVEKVSIKINAPNFGDFNPILLFILLFIFTFALNTAIDPLTSRIEISELYKETVLEMLESHIIYVFIAMAILPALLEEWFCRGIILRGLLKHINPTKAIIWSAFIFAVIHLNLWQGIPCFISGCFDGWIYYKTRCIWTVIFMHFVNNAFVTFTYYTFPEIPIDYPLADLLPDKGTYWLLVSVSIGIISLSIFLIDKYIKSPKLTR